MKLSIDKHPSLFAPSGSNDSICFSRMTPQPLLKLIFKLTTCHKNISTDLFVTEKTPQTPSILIKLTIVFLFWYPNSFHGSLQVGHLKNI